MFSTPRHVPNPTPILAPHRGLRAAMVTALCGIVAAICIAAPLLPKPPPIADEILSTAEITNVRLAIAPLPLLLTKEGKSADQIMAVSEQILEEAGYTVVEHAAAPRLVVTFFTVTKASQKNTVAITAMIDVYQDVSVHRLKMDLNVPTMTIVMTDLAASSRLDDSVAKLCLQAFNLLLKTFDIATDTVRSQGRAESP